MKKYNKFLTYLLSLLVVSFMISCDDSDDSSDDDGGFGVDGGIAVADGFYVAKQDVDPVSANLLSGQVVEADGFATQERSGFLANYVYLTAGNYNVVRILNQQITQTLGGSASSADNAAADCPDEDGTYPVIAAEVDGEAFNIASDGIYLVSYDALTQEIIPYHISAVGIIGSSTDNGWGASTNIDGTLTAEGGAWTATNVLLKKGEWKIRMNCNWSINRRVDDELGFEEDNGYQYFTNFGGDSPSNLEIGGGNFAVNAAGEGGTEEAFFTVAITWTPANGFGVSLEKTGDFTPAAFEPADFNWALTGDATPNGWPTEDADFNDHDFFYSGAGTFEWTLFDGVDAGNGTIALSEGAFKFRANDDWTDQLGWGDVTLTGDTDGFSDDGGNIAVSTAGVGTYMITLTVTEDGESYTANFDKQ